MKKIIFSFALMLIILSTKTFSQVSDWTPPEQGKTRIGVIGNVWHPIGLFFNQDLGGWGLYATAKSNFERTQSPSLNQYNFSGGLSIKIFQNTSRTNSSDLLLGISYNTDPKNKLYEKNDYNLGAELLLMLPFTDKNWRILFGWSSNSYNLLEGLTAGFAYQF